MASVSLRERLVDPGRTFALYSRTTRERGPRGPCTRLCTTGGNWCVRAGTGEESKSTRGVVIRARVVQFPKRNLALPKTSGQCLPCWPLLDYAFLGSSGSNFAYFMGTASPFAP